MFKSLVTALLLTIGLCTSSTASVLKAEAGDEKLILTQDQCSPKLVALTQKAEASEDTIKRQRKGTFVQGSSSKEVCWIQSADGGTVSFITEDFEVGQVPSFIFTVDEGV